MADGRTIRRLMHYRAWADQLTFDAVAALPPGEAVKERPTLFKSIIGTFNHNYLIDRVWQAHLEGRDHGFKARNLVLHADLAELWAAQQPVTVGTATTPRRNPTPPSTRSWRSTSSPGWPAR